MALDIRGAVGRGKKASWPYPEFVDYPFTSTPTLPQFRPPQIWPPPGMFDYEDEPEDYYTGARAWWKDIDQWAYEQVAGGFPAFQPQQPSLGIVPGGVGGGGGGGAGAGELPGPDFLLRDVMEHLRFPYKWQYPSYLRDFGRYIEELLTQNPQYAIPVPEIGEETGELLPTPEDLTSLDYMAEAEEYAAMWNTFIQSLVNLPFFQQQYRVGLRYTPETGWFRSGDVPQLPHPSYL